jgi:hypothetical protein
MGFQIPNLALPPGTYWLQVQDVTTRWNSWSFWAESAGPSTAYHLEVGQNGDGMATQVPSESFTIYGEWVAAGR